MTRHKSGAVPLVCASALMALAAGCIPAPPMQPDNESAVPQAQTRALPAPHDPTDTLPGELRSPTRVPTTQVSPPSPPRTVSFDDFTRIATVLDLAFRPDGATLAILAYGADFALGDLTGIWILPVAGSAPADLSRVDVAANTARTLAYDPATATLALGREANDDPDSNSSEIVLLPRTETAQVSILRIDSPLWDLAFSPDGSLLAMAVRQGLVLYRYPALTPAMTLAPEDCDYVSAIDFMGSSTLVAAAVCQGVVIWDYTTGGLVFARASPWDSVSQSVELAADAEGTVFAASGCTKDIINSERCGRRQVLLTYTATLETYANITYGEGNVILIAISPAAPILAAILPGKVQFWDIRSGSLLSERSVATGLSPAIVRFSPNGERLVIAGAGNPSILFLQAPR